MRKKVLALLSVLVVSLAVLSPTVGSTTQIQKIAFKLLDAPLEIQRDGQSLTITNFGLNDVDISLSSQSSNQISVAIPSGDDVALENTSLAEEELVIEVERPATSDDFEGLTMKSEFDELYSANPNSIVYSDNVVIPALPSTANDVAYALASPAKTSLRYTTFIPEYRVPAPSGICTPIDSREYYFLGDNRTWSVSSTAYRTRLNVYIDWLQGGLTTYSRSVHSTHRYVMDGYAMVLDDSDLASNSTMHLRVDADSSTAVAFEMWQNVPNPLCNPFVTGGIRFDYFVAVERSGVYSVEGVAVKVPNHELYIMDSDDGAWKTIFRRSHVTFDCLSLWAFDTSTCLSTTDYYGVR